MTPTLAGRIQTRLLLLAAIGVPWSLALVPLLAVGAPDAAHVARTVLIAVASFAVIGAVVWEPIYHGIQQFRWEKDWPIGLGLLTFVPESIVVWLIVRSDVDAGRFLVHAGTTWLLVWLVANGPMRVVLIRWRFRGGRVLGVRW